MTTGLGVTRWLAITFFALGGCQVECGRNVSGCNELLNYHENSLLEIYYSRLANRPHDRTFLYFPDVDDDGLDIIALPLEGKNSGYGVVFANANVPPRDKGMGGPFALSRETLRQIRNGTKLTKEVDAFLSDAASRTDAIEPRKD